MIMPEVFLKALTIARNLGHKVEQFYDRDLRHEPPLPPDRKCPAPTDASSAARDSTSWATTKSWFRCSSPPSPKSWRNESRARGRAGPGIREQAHPRHRRPDARRIPLGKSLAHFARGAGAGRRGGTRILFPRRRGQCGAQPPRIRDRAWTWWPRSASTPTARISSPSSPEKESGSTASRRTPPIRPS